MKLPNEKVTYEACMGHYFSDSVNISVVLCYVCSNLSTCV